MDNLIDKIPNVFLSSSNHNGDAFNSFQGTVQLNAWKGFQSRQGAYGSIDTNNPSDGVVNIDIGAIVVKEMPAIIEAHVQAYNYLVQNQEAIQQSILTAILASYPGWQDEYEYDAADKASLMPDVSTIDDFKNLIGLTEIHVLDVSKDGVAYVGYQFGCTWDDEHGLGVMTHKDRIVDIGGADSSFLAWIAEKDLAPEQTNADSEAHYKLPTARYDKPIIGKEKQPWWKFW
jgi:hypothetical protein